jgi:hypothetical protein
LEVGGEQDGRDRRLRRGGITLPANLLRQIDATPFAPQELLLTGCHIDIEAIEGGEVVIEPLN